MAETTLIDAVISRLRDRLASDVWVGERYALHRTNPNGRAVAIMWDADRGEPNPYIQTLQVDVDVFAPGPDTGEADALARQVEGALHGWSVVTSWEGRSRLWGTAREAVDGGPEDWGHVALTFTARGFLRLEE